MTFFSSDLTIASTKLQIHENASIISKKAKAISEQLNIIDPNFYKGHSSMTNYIYINCPISKMVNVLVSYDVFYFLDDYFGEDTCKGELPDLKKLLNIWQTGIVYNSKNKDINSLYKAIKYVSDLIRNDSPKSFFQQYSNSLFNHLSASLTKEKYSSVDQYIDIRLKTSGMHLLIDLIEYVHTIYLPKEILEDKKLSLKTLQNKCALIGALSNDLFSYAKEKHSDYNLINAFLKTKEAINYNDAVRKSIQKINLDYSEFKKHLEKSRVIYKSLPINYQHILTTYFNALEIVVAACYHWQKNTTRYYHPDNIFEDLKEIERVNFN